MPGPTTNPEIVYDEAGRVLDANQAAAELTGIPLGRLRGMHMRDFHHPDELPAAEERIRTMPFNKPVTYERWFRCCNRRYTRVTATGSRRPRTCASNSMPLPSGRRRSDRISS